MSAIPGDEMVNKSFNPSTKEQEVLDVFKLGRDEGEPWGYATPMRITLITGYRKQRINEALDSLTAAGWIKQVDVDGERVRGLYRFVEDPRDD